MFHDHFNLAHEAIAAGVKKGLKAVAFALQEEAIEKITDLGLVDTGALRLSVFVEADGVNQRDMQLATALAVAKKGAMPAMPGKPIDTDVQARVGVCVNYGIYLEMGTVHMPARPFLAPAAYTVNVKAQDLMARFVSAEIRKAA